MTLAKFTDKEKSALRYLLEKRLAEESLHDFVRQAWPVVEGDMPFKDSWHIRAICQHLEAVTQGKITQLIVNVPPSTSKSLITCVFWPAWIWIRQASHRFMFSSYSDTLSARDSIRCRTLLTSTWYQERWPMAFRQDTNAASLYENTSGGWRMSTSTGGRATGYHPDYIVADDPNNVREAESDAEREAVNNWWDGTISSRGIMRGVRQVVIMQRLHASDLSGHLLSKGTWDHLCLPMRYDASMAKPTSIGWKDPRKVDGQLLWPEVFTKAIVEKLEKAMGQYHAAGQLQQRPSPRGGGMFKRDWFDVIKAAPHDIMSMVRYWDKAGTAGGDGARTAGVLMGRCKSGQYVILDVVKNRWNAVERERAIKTTAELDKQKWGYVEQWVEQEPGSGGKESAESTVQNLAGFTCKIERVTGSKEVRAEPFASQCSVRNVKLLAGEWCGEFIEEAELFPMGKTKDQIDAGGGAFNKLSAGTGAIGLPGDFCGGRTTERLNVFERLTFNERPF